MLPARFQADVCQSVCEERNRQLAYNEVGEVEVNSNGGEVYEKRKV